jgi:hypothetical protein
LPEAWTATGGQSAASSSVPLRRGHLGIGVAPPERVVVRPDLDNPAAAQYHDLARLPDRAEAVGDDEAGPPSPGAEYPEVAAVE